MSMCFPDVLTPVINDFHTRFYLLIFNEGKLLKMQAVQEALCLFIYG